MICLKENKDCCGCNACMQCCPKSCIVMQEDKEGFLYPVVDMAACIDCGLCENVCPFINQGEERKPLHVYAAKNRNEEIRLQSSSGGIFYILAEKVINEGGIVFGARFDEQWQVVIDYADTMDGVKLFMGSKYVQARMETAYKDVLRFLKEDRKVLFSGTPCQIAGLHHFLRKPHDNLLSVDFVCHGVPSPKVWRIYLDEVIREGERVSNVEFRNKQKGWKNFHFCLAYNQQERSTSLLCSAHENHYMRAFLADLILRPSCHDCKAKSGRSHSDVTIADFWGIWNVNPKMSDDKGTSLLFLNTEKGKTAIDYEKIAYAESDYVVAKQYNSAWIKSVVPHPKRVQFFEQLNGAESVVKLIDKSLQLLFLRRCEVFCKRAINRTLQGVRGGAETIQLSIEVVLPSHPEIISITFRNKKNGWQNYRMEIKLKDKNDK